jgi:flagellar motor switch protein FliM
VEPVLTPEEVAAVVAQGTGLSAPAERVAERVDLAGGDRLLRALLPSFDPVGRRLADRLRALLTPSLKTDVRVQVSPPEIASPSSWPRAGGFTVVASLRVGDMPQGGLLVIDPTLGSLLIARAFGSRRPAEEAPQRALSSVERRVAGPIVESIVAEIGAAFAAVAPLPFALGRIESDERAFDLQRWGGAGLLFSVSLQAGETSGSLALGLSSAALEPLRVQLGRGDGAGRDPTAPEHTARIGRLVRDATVELRAVIGGARLSLAQLVALRTGDVIHLDRAVGDPIPVEIEGTAKFRGRPVLSRGSLAVEVSGRMEESR